MKPGSKLRVGDLAASDEGPGSEHEVVGQLGFSQRIELEAYGDVVG